MRLPEVLTAGAGCEGDRIKDIEGDWPNGICFSEACLLLSATASGSVTPTAVVAGMPFFTACTGLLHVTALTGRLPANVHESASDEGAHDLERSSLATHETDPLLCGAFVLRPR